VVGLDVVGTQTNELDTARGEFGLELGEGAQLGGADGGEVIGVREEDGPLVTDELVEVDGAVGGIGIEIGGSRAQTETIEWSVTCRRVCKEVSSSSSMSLCSDTYGVARSAIVIDVKDDLEERRRRRRRRKVGEGKGI
jgi:hypothetical protein